MTATSQLAGRPAPSIRPAAGLGLAAAVVLILFFTHAPYFGLPFFWDELGQFVPAALDLYSSGSLVPHSAVPNAHPPGVMAYLALVWRIFGYSIPATRAAMLLLASLAVTAAFCLAWELCRSWGPALAVVLLLLADPLFYTQAMMAQLDMPAVLFTLLTLWLLLKERYTAGALASTVLVLEKETGVVLPIVLGLSLLLDARRSRHWPPYLAPLAALGVWFLLLWRATGHVFGDTGFTHYNLGYALNPARVGFCLLRRFYYLFLADFRWIGSLAILYARRRTCIYSHRAWKIIWCFIAAHVLTVSLLGGAELERYLLPVIPLVYIAMAAAAWAMQPIWRNVAVGALAAGLLAGLFFNPPFPFPFENNLAMADFVQLHRAAAQYLEQAFPGKTIYTAWPLTGALRNPAFGYVGRDLAVAETADLRYSTLEAIDPARVEVLVLYSRTWEPPWGVLRWRFVQRFLSRFYQYERQMTAAEVREHFALEAVQRWDRRGQWVEIYARPNGILAAR